ncbi:MAG: hypothetical protein A3J48_03380 [Candidatus Doudnabacteria bacterium RIFCSPHIGHO2_02_FULL_46_11]|uniref:Uncharacterized protein n=1 Tax=Candidatus Doudnabacteria bacterium RIFCSPHIGHO2_02_FULL_46_11 TaxID=1817832 RepID=A0A1F5P882_9BACT|nr:MAG: hypothetical protein A3J48_03380 [Candidatus Doudnabacteria bacterium RIFCSPHIGHO2_02_FULL_46_11]
MFFCGQGLVFLLGLGFGLAAMYLFLWIRTKKDTNLIFSKEHFLILPFPLLLLDVFIWFGHRVGINSFWGKSLSNIFIDAGLLGVLVGFVIILSSKLRIKKPYIFLTQLILYAILTCLLYFLVPSLPE